MKWFDRWFARKCRWAWENKDVIEQDITEEQTKRRIGMQLVAAEDSPGWHDGLRINVKKVIGGFVISFRSYDKIKDKSDERHYIITDEQDFNVELGKMITMESMRQS
jgi:hypothetical protein